MATDNAVDKMDYPSLRRKIISIVLANNSDAKPMDIVLIDETNIDKLLNEKTDTMADPGQWTGSWYSDEPGPSSGPTDAASATPRQISIASVNGGSPIVGTERQR